MKKRIVGCLMIIFSLASTAFAGGTIGKEAWLAGFQNILPAALCQDRGFFRVCFNVSADECHSLITDATKSCARQYSNQIPEPLEQPQDGTEWGTKIGVCVGTLIEGLQADKRIHTDKCDDPNAWK